MEVAKSENSQQKWLTLFHVLFAPGVVVLLINFFESKRKLWVQSQKGRREGVREERRERGGKALDLF